jgi:sortase A
VPGQDGNVAIVGHSSNNLFNKGKYKFAFVLLNRMQVGDTFMLNYNSQQYIYKIYERKIVKPNDVSVLGPTDKTATATLITCDPPGTALNRLVVIGEQISPSISKNTAASTASTAKPTIVPGNPESLFQRLVQWIWH